MNPSGSDRAASRGACVSRLIELAGWSSPTISSASVLLPTWRAPRKKDDPSVAQGFDDEPLAGAGNQLWHAVQGVQNAISGCAECEKHCCRMRLQGVQNAISRVAECEFD
jgi:hypothetical protein